jgi:hypothetical protein
MWSYYGAKTKVIDLYPKPKHGKIIEPFAGTARYALKYFDRDVLLVDKYDVIVRIWKWLQQASDKDILGLPDYKAGDVIDRSTFDVIEQAWLVGFMIQAAVNGPRLTVTPMGAKNYPRQKKSIARQLFKIRHWDIRLGSYEDIENQEASWFIDPPYQFGGEYYVKSNKDLDYAALAAWCKSRKGQVIVCENTKATWLPFKPMRKMSGTIHTTTEAIWSNEKTNFDATQMSMDQLVAGLGFWQYQEE